MVFIIKAKMVRKSTVRREIERQEKTAQNAINSGRDADYWQGYKDALKYMHMMLQEDDSKNNNEQ